jgi:hypothetical protein
LERINIAKLVLCNQATKIDGRGVVLHGVRKLQVFPSSPNLLVMKQKGYDQKKHTTRKYQRFVDAYGDMRI